MDNSGPDADPSFLLHPEPAAVHDAPSPSPVDSVHGASAAPSARPPARAAWSQYNPFALVSSWYWPTSPAHAEAAESRLLSRLRFFGRRDSADRTGSRTSVRVSFVDLGDGRHINSLVVDEEHVKEGVAIHQQDSEADGGDDTFGYTPGTEQTKLDIFRADGVERDPKARERRTLVICHGYGAGLGFFYRNFHGISTSSLNPKIYAIDWLGMGRSSRTPLPPLRRSCLARNSQISVEQVVKQTEDYFVDSLEDWRKKVGIGKMTLCGHSLGGYLCAVYALKYPENVDALLLVSPVGIPENPHRNAKPATTEEAEAADHAIRGVRRIPGWISYLWKADFTPQYIIRALGPWGPGMVKRYTERRFAYLDDEDREAMRDYIYHISAASATSEYAISRLLAPGAYAYLPLINRLHELKMPTIFIYGAQDWMDSSAAYRAVQKMHVKAKVEIIPDAGHHLYLDNPPAFDKAVTDWMMENGGE